MSGGVDSTEKDHVFGIFEMYFFPDVAGVIEHDSFVEGGGIGVVLFENNKHIIEGMSLASAYKIIASKLFEVLPSRTIRYDASVEPVEFDHCLDSDLLVHRLVVQFVNFVILLDCLCDAFEVEVVFVEGFVILSQQELILWRSLHWLYHIRFNVQF